MKKTYKYIVIAAMFLVFIAGSCKKAEYNVINDGLYFSEATTSASKKIIIDEKGATLTITPRMVQKALGNVNAKVVVDTNVLNSFNKKNGTNYLPLPDSLVKFASNTVAIKEGEVSAPTISAMIKPFSTAMANSGSKYALALSLQDANGTTLLTDMAKFVYEFDQVIITSVPILNRNTAVKMAMRQDYNTKTWSVEMRINMDRLGAGIGELNNQSFFGAGGQNSEIYIRFGDAPIPGTTLQIKTQGTQINCNTKFAANTWYHLAFVCDGATTKVYVNGILDATLTVRGDILNLSKNNFNMVANSEYFAANCMLSEVRFWTIPITQSQIQNNMFAINPKTEGLEAYWKMNEGKGNVFQDATGHGNTATASQNDIYKVDWKHGVRSDGKK